MEPIFGLAQPRRLEPDGLDEDRLRRRTQVHAHAARRQLPLGGDRERGGHKGYGLGTMVEILCAVLTGAWADGFDDQGRPKHTDYDVGHFFFAIDPGLVRADGEFEDDMDLMMDMLRATPPADPSKPVMVAGDPEVKETAERTRLGIPVADMLIEETRAVAEECGAEFLLA